MNEVGLCKCLPSLNRNGVANYYILAYCKDEGYRRITKET